MEKLMNYQPYFDTALTKIKALRSPHARKRESLDFGWYAVLQNQIVNIGGADFRRPISIIAEANRITKSCILDILTQLILDYAPNCKLFSDNNTSNETITDKLVFIDISSNCLIVVKDIEQDIALITEDYIPEDMRSLMRETNTSVLAQVYLLYDAAHLQFVSPKNGNSKNQGFNAYSLPWLFDTYFNRSEYEAFTDALKKFYQSVDEYLGYSVVRSLSPSTLINFKKITERSILEFNYDQVLQKTITNHMGKKCWIKAIENNKIKHQYLINSSYRILLGNSDYAESLITAEWLFDSMSKAHAIDLTIIGMGYFKAIEQLLFALIQLHDPDYSADSTLGDYATFFKRNRDLILRDDLDWTSKRFVYESIYEYAELRNGYFHKHNIHDPAKIREIRSATYILLFLVLGAHKLTQADHSSLGLPVNNSDDFTKLCDYTAFHESSIFCAAPDGFPEQWFRIVPKSTIPSHIQSAESEKYIYFNVLGSQVCSRFSKKNAPTKIWIGKIAITHNQSLKLDYQKELLIFKNGQFLGPNIVDEEGFTY